MSQSRDSFLAQGAWDHVTLPVQQDLTGNLTSKDEPQSIQVRAHYNELGVRTERHTHLPKVDKEQDGQAGEEDVEEVLGCCPLKADQSIRDRAVQHTLHNEPVLLLLSAVVLSQREFEPVTQRTE